MHSPWQNCPFKITTFKLRNYRNQSVFETHSLMWHYLYYEDQLVSNVLIQNRYSISSLRLRMKPPWCKAQYHRLPQQVTNFILRILHICKHEIFRDLTQLQNAFQGKFSSWKEIKYLSDKPTTTTKLNVGSSDWVQTQIARHIISANGNSSI